MLVIPPLCTVGVAHLAIFTAQAWRDWRAEVCASRQQDASRPLGPSLGLTAATSPTSSWWSAGMSRQAAALDANARGPSAQASMLSTPLSVSCSTRTRGAAPLICFEQPWSMCPLLQPHLNALCDRGVQSLCECGPLEHSHWPVRRSAITRITAHDVQQPNDSPLPT